MLKASNKKPTKNIYKLFKISSLLFFFVFKFCNNLLGQQEPLYNIYPQNPMAINPAYAGSAGIANISIFVRKQSLILQNVGSSQYLSYNTPLAKGKAGMGLQAYNSNFGQAGPGAGGTGFNLSGVYRHHFTDSISVAVGAQAGFSQVPNFLANEFKPTAGLGIYFRTFNSYFGAAMPIITTPSFAISNTTKYYYLRPLFISAGHVVNINEKLDLKFGAVFRHYDKNGGEAIDLNATVWFKKLIGLGIWKNKTGSEVKPENALIISLDAQLNQKFRLGFSYDAASRTTNGGVNPRTGTTSALGLYNLMLRYDFDNLTGKINNFRFF
jgi:type IX secretion system PorP/SprF family membrane protein